MKTPWLAIVELLKSGLCRLRRIKPLAETKGWDSPVRGKSVIFPPPRDDRKAAPTEETPGPTPKRRDSSAETDQHLLNLVDLLDEIALMKQAPAGTSKSLDIVESRLSDLIALSDGEIIRDTDWQPQRQRPVEVVPGHSTEETFVSSRRSGLAINGRVVRKQEVVISKQQTK